MFLKTAFVFLSLVMFCYGASLSTKNNSIENIIHSYGNIISCLVASVALSALAIAIHICFG